MTCHRLAGRAEACKRLVILHLQSTTHISELKTSTTFTTVEVCLATARQDMLMSGKCVFPFALTPCS